MVKALLSKTSSMNQYKNLKSFLKRIYNPIYNFITSTLYLVVAFLKLILAALREPKEFICTIKNLSSNLNGFVYARDWKSQSFNQGVPISFAIASPESNHLRAYFDSHREGNGIWKWLHYFDIYHHHFQKFVGKEVNIVEVGIYSGGSLDMWKNYFGPKCKIYGVDINEACKVYEKDDIKVFIGDQSDRNFWRRFKEQVPVVDIIIDDGGHLPGQQIVTLEELLPHLRPGEVYLCEDIHRTHNEFSDYLGGIISHLNAWNVEIGESLVATPTEFQKAIHSLHFYPFLVVIEKFDVPLAQFIAPKHGTQWQP
jgi:hypothetical protein